MIFVTFAMIDVKKPIGNIETYLENICEQLKNKGLVSKLVLDLNSTSLLKKIADDIYEFDFLYKSIEFVVKFSYEEYDNISHLTIAISSQSYKVDLKDKYLERLKFSLKELLKDDWKRILWLYDFEAAFLSRNLYPNIYYVENQLRQFINEVMNKVYGIEWWENLISSELIDKYKSRLVGYKRLVSGFKNIDDKLLSIDVADLNKIIHLKIFKWNPEYDAVIESYATGKSSSKNMDILLSKLKHQLELQVDVWDKYFSEFLPNDFDDLFKKFCTDRNHVAHNKLLDRQAYNSIDFTINRLKDGLESAMELASASLLSDQIQKKEREHLITIAEKERQETDSGVSVLNPKEIVDEFDSALIEIYGEVEDALRFRQDIEVLEYYGLESKDHQLTLFEVKYKITKKQIKVSYELEINDEPGMSSYLNFKLINEIEECIGDMKLEYINGKAEWDDESSTYMPISENTLSGQEDVIEKMINYIDEYFENLREKVDSEMYFYIKDGGKSPCADIPCEECFEEYICIDKNIAPIGVCLNCGAKNDIKECQRCGKAFIGNGAFCDNCEDYTEKE